MDNAAEEYDLIVVLWRLDGFRGIEGETGQGHCIDEHVAATDSRQMGRLRKLLATLRRRVGQLRRCNPIPPRQ
jgi:hypothetical protein